MIFFLINNIFLESIIKKRKTYYKVACGSVIYMKNIFMHVLLIGISSNEIL